MEHVETISSRIHLHYFIGACVNLDQMVADKARNEHASLVVLCRRSVRVDKICRQPIARAETPDQPRMGWVTDVPDGDVAVGPVTSHVAGVWGPGILLCDVELAFRDGDVRGGPVNPCLV